MKRIWDVLNDKFIGVDEIKNTIFIKRNFNGEYINSSEISLSNVDFFNDVLSNLADLWLSENDIMKKDANVKEIFLNKDTCSKIRMSLFFDTNKKENLLKIKFVFKCDGHNEIDYIRLNKEKSRRLYALINMYVKNREERVA